MLCLLAQISFSFYLAIFKGLISRYNIFTLMKWMFTYAAICFNPFSYHEVSTIHFHEISTSTWACVAYVIVGGTFLAYILMMIGQKTLRPTVISMYNYVQPIVGTSVSILLGMGTFGVAKGIAVALVFTGVYIVTQSKSREQMLAEQAGVGITLLLLVPGNAIIHAVTGSEAVNPLGRKPGGTEKSTRFVQVEGNTAVSRTDKAAVIAQYPKSGSSLIASLLLYQKIYDIAHISPLISRGRPATAPDRGGSPPPNRRAPG